ncbi:MAG: hypothetical protein M1381_02905 [Deltaproteobacteria bacterium]|nr:hypothetical protein [Deltaproteobacteria bacterium]MCL5791968.1 hypothetical protein [Deltaproteobacteria bacterium]
MKLLKWIIIIGVIILAIVFIKDVAGKKSTVSRRIQAINNSNTKKVEQYTTGIGKNVARRINQDTKQAYKGLPTEP